MNIDKLNKKFRASTRPSGKKISPLSLLLTMGSMIMIDSKVKGYEDIEILEKLEKEGIDLGECDKEKGK